MVSKIKNENPDDFATYLAKRQAAAEGREWTPAGAPAAAAPAPAAAAAPAPAAAAPAASSGTSKIKNENPDDFATYLAKRKAAEEGRVWTPGS
jgi:pyruvate dehydrogenase E2 component (dihydrolipoamide acetyltransferase)